MTRVLSIHQPGYLPWPGYLHKILLSDVFVVLDTAQFEKGSFINRNRIRSAQGPTWLSLPVKKGGRFGQKILDVELTGDVWRRKHFRTIAEAYARAPHAARYIPFLEALYGREWGMLADICRASLEWFLDELMIRTEIVYASEMSFDGQKSDLILNVCNDLGASHYLSGVFGRNYLELEDFHRAGVGVCFQDYCSTPYSQVHGADFVPGLSVIDMLMNLGGEEARRKIAEGNISKGTLVSDAG